MSCYCFGSFAVSYLISSFSFCFTLFYAAVIFFHCSIIEKGLLSMFESDSCVCISPIFNSAFIHLIHTKKIFQKKSLSSSIHYWIERFPSVLVLSCCTFLTIPCVYTAAVYETELK